MTAVELENSDWLLFALDSIARCAADATDPAEIAYWQREREQLEAALEAADGASPPVIPDGFDPRLD